MLQLSSLQLIPILWTAYSSSSCSFSVFLFVDTSFFFIFAFLPIIIPSLALDAASHPSPRHLIGSILFLSHTLCINTSLLLPTQRTYRMFRTLGLRHLCVINKYNQVLGIVTRADLVHISHVYFLLDRFCVYVCVCMCNNHVYVSACAFGC